MTPLRPHVKRDLKERNEGVPPVQQPTKRDLNNMNEGATPLWLPGIHDLGQMNSIRFSRDLTLHIYIWSIRSNHSLAMFNFRNSITRRQLTYNLKPLYLYFNLLC